MKGIRGMMLWLIVGMGGMWCMAQDAKVPFKQIERDAQISAQMSALMMVPGEEAAVSRGEGTLAGTSSSSSFVFVPPKAAKVQRTLSPGFFLLNGLHLGLAVFDVEMTQHCIADHHCVEGNPLMPSSQAGQLVVNFAFVGYGTFISYKLKKQESRLWVLTPTLGIGAHVVGVASGFVNY